MKNIKQTSTPYFIVGIILVAFFMTATFYIYGIPKTNDSLLHFTFANSTYNSISQGNLYVQGEPSINKGYGGYMIRFYPPMTAYSLATAYVLTNDWHTAGFLFFWFWMSISGIGLYFLAKEWVSEQIAFLAATLYVFEPYHNAQINSLFANAEFVAGTMLTFCFLFTTRLLKTGKTINIFYLAIFYCLFIWSNIPIMLIGSICLLIYGILYLYFSNGWKSRGLKLLAGFSLGIFAASYYLFRLFFELSWINHSKDEFIAPGIFNFKYFFVDIRGYFFPSDLVLFNFLILLIPPIILILLKAKKEIKQATYPLIAVTVISIFMSTSYSQPVWEVFKILQNAQFPWRWFTVASIGYGIIIALSISTLEQVLSGKKLILTLWASFFVISTAYFSYTTIVGANLLDADFFLLKGEEFTKAVDYKATAQTHDSMQTVWTKDSPFTIEEKVLANQRNVEITKWEGFSKEVRISAGEETDTRFSISYYPHWQAKINDQPTEVMKTSDGVILLKIPKEESVVELNFVEPFVVKLFVYVSAAVWLIMIGFILFNLRKQFYSLPNSYITQ